jgi:hypothetical protein
MRSLFVLGVVLLAAGCTQAVPPPAQVSWQYGAGNGDGVAYPGPKPIFKRAYGLGNGDSVSSGQTAVAHYGYGADGMAGTVIQTDSAPATMTAQPAAAPKPGSNS